MASNAAMPVVTVVRMGLPGASLVGPVILTCLSVRAGRQWRRDDAAFERRWALQRQLWDLGRQILDEQLSDGELQARQEGRQRAAEIRSEAHRRLGLPDEDAPPEA